MQPAAFVCEICAICERIACKSTQSIPIYETPMSPADSADLRRQTSKQQISKHKPQNHKLQITVKTTITSLICLSLRNNAACCIRLRDLRHLRENNTQEYSICQHKRNHNVSRRSCWFTQTKPKTTLTSPICLSLRNNAACCIPLCVICVICGRIHARVLNLLAYMNPQYLPQILLIYADKTQNRKTTLTISTCLCLRNNAACCIRLRNLRYLRENSMQEYSINPHIWNPNVSRWFRWFTQTNLKTTNLKTQTSKPQTSNNHKTTLTIPNCLSLRNNAACCIPLRDLRNLRENIHARVLNLSARKQTTHYLRDPYKR